MKAFSIILSLTLMFMADSGLSQSKNKKFKPEKGMQAIQLLRGEQTIKVGDKIYYSGSVHGSVGEQFSISAEGNGLKLIDEHFAYDNPKRAEMPGGDAAKKTYVYQAEKPGEYTITIKDLFRGDVRSTYNVKITIIN